MKVVSDRLGSLCRRASLYSAAAGVSCSSFVSPLVWVNRSLTTIGRATSTRSPPTDSTLARPNAGTYCATASVSATLPSSNSDIRPAATTGFVIE
jgi:hypothetical protein